MAELMVVVHGAGLEDAEVAFIIGDMRSEFGTACFEQGAGSEFLVSSSDGEAAMVLVLDVEGLVSILRDVVPEGLEPVVTRPTGTMPILVVDAEDEPAIVILGVGDLCS